MRVAISLMVLAIAAPAAAQDKAAAIRAFEEGRALMAEGRYADACPKLETSYRLDAATGTLLNLADCYEKLGKTASAWAAFREAAERAGNQQRDARQAEARRRAAALEPRLIHLTVVAAGTSLTARRDGVDITDLLGVEVPIDPGAHTVEATAPGRLPWRRRVELTGEGAHHTVEIPELEPAPEPPEPKPAPTPSVEPTSAPTTMTVDRGPRRRRLILAGLIGGAGVLTLGSAATLGTVARMRWSDAEKLGCIDGRCPTRAGFDEASRARSLAVSADIAAAAGVAAVLTGALLYYTAPDVEIVPTIGVNGAGVAVAIDL